MAYKTGTVDLCTFVRKDRTSIELPVVLETIQSDALQSNP